MEDKHLEGRGRMSRGLPETVVSAFGREPTESLRERFLALNERDWSRGTNWLHTSSLALYFLFRVRELGITEAVPRRALRELETAHSENSARTRAMFDEFVKVNVTFQRAKLLYANLKGFSLAPRACPDPSYRYQNDLDFLVAQQDAERCRQAMESLGYRLVREHGRSCEFAAGTPEVLSMRDLYRVRSKRTVDIHFVSACEVTEPDAHADQLQRLQLQVWNGFEFPALSECDKLLGQAHHIFHHMQGEWTRAAWMLEFTTAVRSHEGDAAFWADMVALLNKMPQRKVGIGIASLIASRAFDATLPEPFFAAAVGQLPRHIRLWADCYQEHVVFAKHPGSKLYLLLQDVLSQDCAQLRTQRRRRLLPLHLPPSFFLVSRQSDPRLWLKGILAQIRFTGQRLYFHVTGGFRYWIESARWKKLVTRSEARMR